RDRGWRSGGFASIPDGGTPAACDPSTFVPGRPNRARRGSASRPRSGGGRLPGDRQRGRRHARPGGVVATLVLHAIERPVRGGDQLGGGAAVGRERRRSDRGADGDRAAALAHEVVVAE